jgi:hypothetical protein
MSEPDGLGGAAVVANPTEISMSEVQGLGGAKTVGNPTEISMSELEGLGGARAVGNPIGGGATVMLVVLVVLGLSGVGL